MWNNSITYHYYAPDTVLSTLRVLMRSILPRSQDTDERMNEGMNKLKNERILDRDSEAGPVQLSGLFVQGLLNRWIPVP